MASVYSFQPQIDRKTGSIHRYAYDAACTRVKIQVRANRNYDEYNHQVDRESKLIWYTAEMVRNCQDLRDAVALCLQRSECVMVHRNTPKKCFEDPELNKTLPQPCLVHIFRYIDCKRGQADMTKRFRGNGVESSGKYVEDLEMMKRGDFDASAELHKLSVDQRVEPKGSHQ